MTVELVRNMAINLQPNQSVIKLPRWGGEVLHILPSGLIDWFNSSMLIQPRYLPRSWVWLPSEPLKDHLQHADGYSHVYGCLCEHFTVSFSKGSKALQYLTAVTTSFITSHPAADPSDLVAPLTLVYVRCTPAPIFLSGIPVPSHCLRNICATLYTFISTAIYSL
jgi:hypothetical protein